MQGSAISRNAGQRSCLPVQVARPNTGQDAPEPSDQKPDLRFPKNRADLTAWIQRERAPKTANLDPYRPHAFFLEEERSAPGEIVQSACVLLTNKECPWRCLMCDLWKNTLDTVVPPGAIPRQIEYALGRLGARPIQVKLYNSGSFFDRAAIPPEDYPAIAELVSFAKNVVVESHPRLVGERVLRFRDRLQSSLEVAIGLETANPSVLARLNKRFDLAHFTAAAGFLRKHGIALRVFVLVKPPFMGEQEAIDWAVKSAEFAFDHGASVVSLIPTRTGNGALERLAQTGDFIAPSISTLEQSMDLALRSAKGRVFADTWDLQRFSRCNTCLAARRERLEQINLTQQRLPAIDCRLCDPHRGSAHSATSERSEGRDVSPKRPRPARQLLSEGGRFGETSLPSEQ